MAFIRSSSSLRLRLSDRAASCSLARRLMEVAMSRSKISIPLGMIP